MALRISIVLIVAAYNAGCTNPGMVGDECVDSSDCGAELSCFPEDGTPTGPRRCMHDCDLTMMRLCEDGAVCTDPRDPVRPADLGFCFIGGSMAIGSSCTTNFECVRGAICVILVEGDPGTCYAACSTDDAETCAATEVCSPLESMGTRGFCEGAPP